MGHVIEAPPSAGLFTFLHERRLRRSEAERASAARGLSDVFTSVPWLRGVRCVALYESDAWEPGTQVLRSSLARRGIDVLMPFSGSHGVSWAFDLPDALGPRPFGRARRPAMSPEGPTLADVDVVLVPAFAVDTLGHRLSRNPEEYESALHDLNHGAPVLGVVHDVEVFDASLGPLPADLSVRPVDGVLTPTRILPLSSRCPQA
jgi:5-formyltetrahydrofolate cyclo-ligase